MTSRQQRARERKLVAHVIAKVLEAVDADAGNYIFDDRLVDDPVNNVREAICRTFAELDVGSIIAEFEEDQVTKGRSPQKQVDAFNKKHEVGTKVRYWTGMREGPGKSSTTRTVAQVLSGHTAVVWVADHPACIALSHIAPE